MPLKLLVNSEEFTRELVKDIGQCKKSFYAQTLSFEADKAGLFLANLFFSLPNNIDKKLIVDDYTFYIMNDRFLYSFDSLSDKNLQRERRETILLLEKLRASGVKIEITNPINWKLYKLSARNHKKILSIDGNISYIGGINFSEHNFEWHDLMLKIEKHPFNQLLEEDFLGSFNKKNSSGVFTNEDETLLFFNGTNDRSVTKKLFEVISSAEKEVFVQSPYLSDPFFKVFSDLKKTKNVDIKIVSPIKNNWGLYDSYTRHLIRKGNLNIFFYPRMTHLKAILVDKKTLIIGSSNFDYFSIQTHQELTLITKNQAVINDFVSRIYNEDLKISTPANLKPSKIGEFSKILLHFLFKFLSLLNRIKFF